MTATCHPGHEGHVDAEDLYAAKAARDHWAALEPDLEHHPGASDAVAAAFSEHGHHLRNAIRESMSADVRSMRHVRSLQEHARDDHPATAADGQKTLAKLGVGAELMADATERKLRTIGAGVALSVRTGSDLLALSAGGSAQCTTVGLAVRHTMLSDGGHARAHTYGAQRHRFLASDGHGQQRSDPEVQAPEKPLRDAKEKPSRRSRRARRR